MIKNPLNCIPVMNFSQESSDQMVKFAEMEGSSTPTSFSEVCLSQDASCAPIMATEIINQFLGLELPRLALPLRDEAFVPRLLSLQNLLLTLQHCIESSRSVESACWKQFFDLLNQFVEKSFSSSTALLPLRLFCLFTTLGYFIIDRALFEPGLANILVQLMGKIRSLASGKKDCQALCIELPYSDTGVIRLLRQEAQRQAQQQYTREISSSSRRLLSRPELWNDLVFSQQSVAVSQSQVTLPIPSQIASIVDQIQQWNQFVQSVQSDLSAVLLRWLHITFSPSLSAMIPSSSHAIKLANAILRDTIAESSLNWIYKDALPADHMVMVLVLCQRAAGNGQSLALIIQRNLLHQSDERDNCNDKQWRLEVEFRFRMAVIFLSHSSFVLIKDHMVIQLIHQLLQQVLILDDNAVISEDKRQIKWIRRLLRDALYLCFHRLQLLLHCKIDATDNIHALVVDICHRQLNESRSCTDNNSRATAAYIMLSLHLFAPHCMPIEEHHCLVDQARHTLSSMSSDIQLLGSDLVAPLLSLQERMNDIRNLSTALLLAEDWCIGSEANVEEHQLLQAKEMTIVQRVLEALKPFESSSNNSLTVNNAHDNTEHRKIDYFSQLPLELLRFILSHLTYKRVIRLSTLNSHFHSAAKCEQLWQQLFRRSFPRIHVFTDELREYLRHNRSFPLQNDCGGTKLMCTLCTKKRVQSKTKLQCCQHRHDQHQWRLLFQNAADASADAWRKGWTQFRLCPLVGCSRAIKGSSNEEKRHLLAHQKEENKKLEKRISLLAKKMG